MYKKRKSGIQGAKYFYNNELQKEKERQDSE
jgi:hypothetical protein